MDKIALLHTVPIFKDLSDKDVITMSEKMVTRSYNKGQIILLEEAMGETFFVIANGSVKITRLSDDGREVILAMLGEGDFFGEMSLLDGEGRSANVVALDDAKVFTLSRNDFLDILQKFPKIAISLLEELARRLRKSDQQIESLSLSDVEHRIGMTLVRLSEELGKIKNGNVNIHNFPYQQDIANMAGTSRETVSRTLSLLEEKGLVTREGRTLTIFDYSAFCRAFA
ncbi:MAG TPA: Crp/Fnr family transcriptional regulator [Candidatus Marinimicrobia bacterium]|jgi:CRP-like cAMP-binding protein|nr:Crp/Fnr family transcriptional regulator [Candidatus Neomarinimicrobiota bacterium]MDP7217578.1 Crp/Fnr family transcriptional regulator [Candidatus Neomarinimicrobiota bacterium]MDP7436351.1 Crp/Fnr family transcriptional regulator [Candidatus Neomarinimicrobiota bacterium]HBN44862.1 Crp/Fnr family transcriptional regulator [Candidatus Neomarinimicrobiota bacterium]HJL75144.1 Crp/Fnr family transcriptional regulator [Candidatus Neomarinimicrobiota bacterium]|tara:strand:- start:16940 stop:17620 length:681 start_codon:yes stop_codon:yes gene_type:complete